MDARDISSTSGAGRDKIDEESSLARGMVLKIPMAQRKVQGEKGKERKGERMIKTIIEPHLPRCARENPLALHIDAMALGASKVSMAVGCAVVRTRRLIELNADPVPRSKSSWSNKAHSTLPLPQDHDLLPHLDVLLSRHRDTAGSVGGLSKQPAAVCFLLRPRFRRSVVGKWTLPFLVNVLY